MGAGGRLRGRDGLHSAVPEAVNAATRGKWGRKVKHGTGRFISCYDSRKVNVSTGTSALVYNKQSGNVTVCPEAGVRVPW